MGAENATFPSNTQSLFQAAAFTFTVSSSHAVTGGPVTEIKTSLLIFSLENMLPGEMKR